MCIRDRRYVDTLAEFEIPATAEEATPLVNGVFDLSLRPFLPTPGAKRPAVFVYAGRTLEEQRAASNWMQARAGVLTPVSYTHLDVYKRQQLARAIFLPPDVRFSPTLDRKVTEVLMAVSYTHLDVYKRQ